MRKEIKIYNLGRKFKDDSLWLMSTRDLDLALALVVSRGLILETETIVVDTEDIFLKSKVDSLDLIDFENSNE